MSHDPHDKHHPEHLAHHFDSLTQQFESGKLGMWLFLATEILMFGGLFVAYTIYRANHPDIYMYAHQALDTRLGAINTVVLLVSSFTVAWAVRAAQKSQRRLLVALLALTFLGGGGFMVIKTIEYYGKYAHGLWIGPVNAFYYDTRLIHEESGELRRGLDYIAHHGSPDDAHGEKHGDEHHDVPAAAEHAPDHTLAERSTIPVAATGPVGTTPAALDNPLALGRAEHVYPAFDQLASGDQRRTHIFFQIYYCMTGLHGLHVLVGMGVLFWLLYKAGDTLQKAWIIPFGWACLGAYFLFFGFHIGPMWARVLGLVLLAWAALSAFLRLGKARVTQPKPGEFGERYFAPVEIGGLYWHLVDLIWIFLFPLLYLIR